MSQAKYDFPDAVKGDTYTGVLINLSVNDVLLDLTDATIAMQLKPSTNPDEIAGLQLTSAVDGGITITDAPNGQFRIDEQIIDITPKNYFYDIEITFPDERVKTYIYGRWKVVQDITELE